MSYIFAADKSFRQKHGRDLAKIYQFLCSRYGNVAIYHRSCKKNPLFSADATVICPTRESFDSFSRFSKNCIFLWDVFDKNCSDWDNAMKNIAVCCA